MELKILCEQAVLLSASVSRFSIPRGSVSPWVGPQLPANKVLLLRSVGLRGMRHDENFEYFWHPTLHVSLDSKPSWDYSGRILWNSGSLRVGILDIYRTSRLPLRGIVFSFNFRQMLTGFSRLITASWLSAVSLQLPWVCITHRTLAANFKVKIPTEWFSFGFRFSPKCRNEVAGKFNQMFKEC